MNDEHYYNNKEYLLFQPNNSKKPNNKMPQIQTIDLKSLKFDYITSNTKHNGGGTEYNAAPLLKPIIRSVKKVTRFWVSDKQSNNMINDLKKTKQNIT